MKVVYVFLALLTVQTGFSQNSEFSELLDFYQSEKQFNGVVLVATNGTIDFLAAKGLANRETNTALSTDSKFKIASVSKVFTAILIMKLVEEQKLLLNGTLAESLPEYTGAGKDQITIYNLLTYSSGIDNQLEREGIKPYQNIKTLDAFIETYCSRDLVYTPGAKSVYGNTEYILLHKIIEKVTGMTYENYLHQIILEPLGLKNTQITKARDIVPGLAQSYTYDEETQKLYNDAPYYPELYFGSGALYATAEDLLKLDQTLFNAQILNQQTTQQLLEIHPELGNTAFGFWGSSGWGSFEEPFYYRTGGILGSTANWIHTTEKGKTIIVLSNTDATNLYEFSEKLYQLSLKQ